MSNALPSTNLGAVVSEKESALSSASCFHCALPVDSGKQVVQTIAGEQQVFCCHGCATVCESIYNAGLDGFYSRRQQGEALAPPPELSDQLAFYDIDEIQQDFVDSLDTIREANLLIEGIHCAACVWLIEHSLRKTTGIIEAKVNLTGRQLKLKWNNDQLALSLILKRLGQLGYGAVPYDAEAAEGSLNRENRDLLYRMAFAAFGMMNLLWISIALYTGADDGEFRTLFHWIGFALATPVLVYSGKLFYVGAWSGIKNRRLGMDLPIALGASMTYCYSVFVTISATSVGDVYYDTVVNFLFIILVGRYLEAVSKSHAVSSTQRLLDLQPRVACVIRSQVDGLSEETIVPIRSVLVGDRVLVKPGERIPVDGLVEVGSSRVDESMLTGESEPVVKKAGLNVCAGTMNGNGALQIQVTNLLSNTALGRIIHLVEEAQASKAPIQCVADRIVPWFVCITLMLATATFVWWFNQGIELALMSATAVLIITCPCAFGLATPMSIAVASGLGARNGILVKNGEVLESLSDINHFVFDKTGTLTEGHISVTSIATEYVSWQRDQALPDQSLPEQLIQLMSVVADAERQSEHPIAQAVIRFAADAGISIQNRCEEFASHPGYGISALVDNQKVVIGTAKWLDQQQVSRHQNFDQVAKALDKQGIGSIRCAIDGNEIAILGIEDSLRPHAKDLIDDLKAQGMRVTLLSGDRRATAISVAERLGGMEVIAEVLPDDKDSVVAGLQAEGHRVVMVGDGVNDAPALVRADVGIALGSGTDVSIASADIVLMSNELDKVRLATRLSRRTLKTIRQNIAISISYNIIMVPLAMMALVTPLVAAITMPISSLLVIGNAARIATLFKKK